MHIESSPNNTTLTAIQGIWVGHHQHPRRPTGCTVVLCPKGMVAGVDVRGAAPGTRETDLLSPGHSVPHVHALLLSGGSAFGLDAASGVMRWLEARGHGLRVGSACVPIVPGAVIFGSRWPAAIALQARTPCCCAPWSPRRWPRPL